MLLRRPDIVPLWALPASLALLLGVLWMRRKRDGGKGGGGIGDASDVDDTTEENIYAGSSSANKTTHRNCNGNGNIVTPSVSMPNGGKTSAGNGSKSNANKNNGSTANGTNATASGLSSASNSPQSPTKLGKSAPIDIQPNRLTPVTLTNQQIDRDILKVAAEGAAANKTGCSSGSSCDSPSALSDSGERRRRFSFGQRKRTVREGTPIVIKATKPARISPEHSFAEAKYETLAAPATAPITAPTTKSGASAAARQVIATNNVDSTVDVDEPVPNVDANDLADFDEQLDWAAIVEEALAAELHESQSKPAEPAFVAATPVKPTQIAAPSKTSTPNGKKSAKVNQKQQNGTPAQQSTRKKNNKSTATDVNANKSTAAAAPQKQSKQSANNNNNTASLPCSPGSSKDSGQGGSPISSEHSAEVATAASEAAAANTIDTTNTANNNNNSASANHDDDAAADADNTVISHYDFLIVQDLIGSLLGRKGAYVKEINRLTGTKVFIKNHPLTNVVRIASLEGTSSQIAEAFRMIRNKFPLKRFPVLSLDRVHVLDVGRLNHSSQLLQLELVEDINNDVIVSWVVSGGHMFVQQPVHPSHPNLALLEKCMWHTYERTQAPELPPAMHGRDAVCVVKCGGKWLRAQVGLEAAGECVVKFLDYGGFATIARTDMRQIRADFMSVPFQATECVLANVRPLRGDGAKHWQAGALQALVDLTSGRTLQAQVCGYTVDGLASVHLYCQLTPTVSVVLVVLFCKYENRLNMVSCVCVCVCCARV